MPTDFTLPELGEQIESGDVLRVLVKPGDTIAKDQAVLELETDKATIEVPSSVAGKVKEIKVKAGDKVKVGQAILSVEDQGAPKPAAAEAERCEGGRPRRRQAAAKGEPAKAEARAEAGATQSGRSGQSGGETAPKPPEPAPRLRQDRATKSPTCSPTCRRKTSPAKPDKAGVKDRERRSTGGGAGRRRAPAFSGRDQGREGGGAAPQDDRKVVDINRGARAPAEAAAPANDMPPAPAAPSVRRMARELGVDVNEVSGSGPGGRISVEDVKEHAKRLVAGGGGGGGAAASPCPTSRAGARSSGSRCARSGGRPPNI